ECRPGGLGVRVEGVSLHDLHPPQEVVQAYHEVTRAMERRDKMVNDANADRLRRRREQEARSLGTVRTARADSYEKVRQDEARLADVLVRHSGRSRLSVVEEVALLAEAAAAQLGGQGSEAVRDEYTRTRKERLARQRALTDFRLYWDTLAGALGGRAK